MKEIYVLDACAIIAGIKRESGWTVIGNLFEKAKDGEIRIIVNKINLLEVYYGIRREYCEAYANEMLENVVYSTAEIVDISMDVLIEAGVISKKDKVKILGNGALSAKLTVSAHAFSKSAISAIEATGGNTLIL